MDNPHATRLTIHILAAVAEHEREMISTRTKAALAVVSSAIAANGAWTSRRSGQPITRLGNPRLAEARARSLAMRRPQPPPPEVVGLMTGLAAQGVGLRAIARRLNGLGLRTRRGKQWYSGTVGKVLALASIDGLRAKTGTGT